MKKITLLLFACIVMTGCSSGVSQSEYDKVVAERDQYKAELESFSNKEEIHVNVSTEESTEVIETQSESVKEDILTQLEVSEYSMENSIGDTYYVLVVKNNSPDTLKINANCTAKDSSGALIGAASSEAEAIESGFEICMLNYFDGVKDAASFDYKLDVKKDEYFKPVLSDLQYEVSKTDKKAIVSCVNIGDKSAEFVEGKALFFKDGTMINYSSTYFTDDDNEIKPGDTIVKEFNSYEIYDDVKIYFSGRRH